MKINILYVIWSLEVGGAERIVISLAKYINKDKYNPIVCCLNHKGVLAEELDEIGIKVLALDKKPGIDLSIIPKLIKIFKEHRIQIVHTHLWTSDFWGRIAAKFAGVPVIVSTAHNVDFWKPKIFLFIDRFLTRFSDRIIAVSEEVKNFYIKTAKLPEEKIVTVYNGIELAKFDATAVNRLEKIKEFNFNTSDKIIGIIGRLVEQKGQAYFLEMMLILKQNYPNIKSLVIGDGPLKENLIRKTKELHLEENVIFTGLRNDVADLLKAIDILVSSSTYEGLPMILLEAMAAAKPIVATRVGGNPEIIDEGKTGFLVPAKDPQALANRVSALLNNSEYAQRIGKSAQEKVHNLYSIEKMLQDTENIYDKLLTQKKVTIKKIKITLIIDNLEIGGAQKQFIELVKNIDRNKFKIIVVALSIHRINLLKELVDSGIEVRLIDQWGKICVPAFVKLFKLLKNERPDIVHTYLFTASLYGRIVAKLIGIPVVIVSERSTDNWKKSSYIWMDRILAKVTDRILVNAQTIKESLVKREKIPDKKIQIIYNGLDLNKFDSGRGNKDQIRENLGVLNGNLVIGIIGRLSKEKDHLTFLNAAKQIISTTPRVNFIIVGDGHLRKELEDISINLGIKDSVIFMGNTSNVSDVLIATDILVSASLYEGCSNAILEAMATGLPVVATKVGGNKEIVTDGITGILITPQDPDALAEAVLSLLKNAELMKSMGKKGRERIEADFILSKMVKNTEEVYETLINQN